MKSKIQNTVLASLSLAFCVCYSVVTTVEAQVTTAFTYNGALYFGGSPASGGYDLSFTLYPNALGTGSAIGSLTNNAVSVTNGLFTVALDFGGVFNGSNYWLQLAARASGGTTFTNLTPLQPMRPVPYAIYAANAGTTTNAAVANNFSGALTGDVTGTQGATAVATVGGLTAATIASGANAANAATSANTPNTIVQRDSAGNFLAGNVKANLTGNATSATTAAIFTGNIADSQLSANVPLLNGTNAFTGTNTFSGVTIATNTNNVVFGKFTGNGNSLTNLNSANLTAGTAAINISGNAATATLASNLISGIRITNAFLTNAVITNSVITNSVFGGNGVGLTNLNPANISAGTAGISITGNAATATTASAAGGVTAANLATGANLANAATSANTPSTIVERDGNGNFAAGIITANLAGNATLASNLISGIRITNAFLTNAVITNSIIANSVFGGNGAGLTNLNPAKLSAGTAGISITGNAATATDANFASTATSAGALGGLNPSSLNTPNTVVIRDLNGSFNAGRITANLAGNATAATNLIGVVTDSNLPFKLNDLDSNNQWPQSMNVLGDLSAQGSFFAQFQVGSAFGFSTKEGTGGINGANTFNLFWTGFDLQGWVDNVLVAGSLSDPRLKEEIKPMRENALARIMALKPVSFKFKNIPGTMFTGCSNTIEGFLATEMQEVVPSAVRGNKDDMTSDGKIQPMSIKELPLLAVLTKAVQEQQHEIEALKAKASQVEALQQQVNELKEMVKALANK